MQPAAVGLPLGARILPHIPPRHRKPDEQRPERLARRDADRPQHPSDAAGEIRDDGPDGQETREDVENTANEKGCWHFGHAMVTYATHS